MTDEKPPEKKKHKGIKNLRPVTWKPGQSGNPAGRPKGALGRATILKKFMNLTYKDSKGLTKPQPFGSDDKTPLTVREAVELALIRKALGGDVSAIKQIREDEFGKVPDIITGDPDAPIYTKNENKDLSGEALIAELERRGLPTTVLEK